MNQTQPKVFNIADKRPQVLVVGNGLIYDSEYSWDKMIKGVSRPGIDLSYYEELDEKGEHVRFLVPNTILTMSTSDTKDKDRHNKYVSFLGQKSYPENGHLQRLLKIPFDAVLTTNYTYELEAALRPGYPKYRAATKRRYAFSTKADDDPKYLLHTFNRVHADGPDIWHIHGELRRPSSMILSHDEYARYVAKILQYNGSRKNEYSEYMDDVRFKSWIDYYVLGDVYMIGLGMDYSEFDLWWLLGRRQREESGAGRFFFYEPVKTDNQVKHRALRDCGVQVETCGIGFNGSCDYDAFYTAAIEHIESRVIIDR